MPGQNLGLGWTMRFIIWVSDWLLRFIMFFKFADGDIFCVVETEMQSGVCSPAKDQG